MHLAFALGLSSGLSYRSLTGGRWESFPGVPTVGTGAAG
jgi:hypothetical protein